MERQTFKTEINASREKVWDVLWNDKTYRQWTAPFAAGCHAQTDWKEGSKVLFLDPGGSGMVAKIAKKNPPKYMSFQHVGIVEDGKEDTTSHKVKGWAGAEENYTLEEKGGMTHLTVEMDIDEKYLGMFENTWPKALEKVKQLAEQ